LIRPRTLLRLTPFGTLFGLGRRFRLALLLLFPLLGLALRALRLFLLGLRSRSPGGRLALFLGGGLLSLPAGLLLGSSGLLLSFLKVGPTPRVLFGFIGFVAPACVFFGLPSSFRLSGDARPGV
jgi:hypothetical protein